jgi:succinoglycan biosynthesis transport protein ExoP
MSNGTQRTSEQWSLTSSLPGIGLQDLMRMVQRRIVLLASCVGVCVAVSLLYYFLAAEKFESSAQILVMKKDSKLAARGAEGNDESDTRVSEDLLATHMQILQSRQIVGQALKQNGYDQLPSIVNKLKSDEDATDFVIERLYVTRGGTGQAKMGHVLNARFRHTSPKECQEIMAAIVASYKSFLGEKFQDVSKEAAELISHAKVDLASDLQKAQDDYQTFREKAPLLWKGDESANVHRVNYEELEAALSEIRVKTAESRARLDVVRAAAQDQDANNASDLERLALLDDDNIERVGLLVTVDKGDANTAEFQSTQPARLEGARAEHEAYLNLMMKEKTLRVDLGPDHPQVQDAVRQQQIMRGFLKEKKDSLGNIDDKLKLTPRNLVQAYVKLLENDLATMERREKEIKLLADKEHDSAKALVSYELRGETMRLGIANKQQLYDAAIARLREINLVKDYAGFVTEVIAPPELGVLMYPKFWMCLAMGSILGLLVGVASAGTAEMRDPFFVGPGDVAQSLDLPILTQVPNLATNVVVKRNSRLSPTISAFHRPRSREAESIRGLRTALFFRMTAGENKVIQLTSANPADGKSTLAVNLAASIAQAGDRTLLIDCDMRRPSAHKIFGLEPKVGLSNVIVGDVELADAIIETEVPNLSLLPCGPSPNNPAELLTNRSFAELLTLLRDRYDRIVLDTPPLLAVADPAIVSALADGVVMAIRLTRDSRMQVVRSKELLETAKANLLGVAINGYDLTRRHRLAAYEYGTGYGYTDDYTTEVDTDAYYTEEEEDGQLQATNGKPSLNGHNRGTKDA